VSLVFRLLHFKLPSDSSMYMRPKNPTINYYLTDSHLVSWHNNCQKWCRSWTTKSSNRSFRGCSIRRLSVCIRVPNKETNSMGGLLYSRLGYERGEAIVKDKVCGRTGNRSEPRPRLSAPSTGLSLRPRRTSKVAAWADLPNCSLSAPGYGYVWLHLAVCTSQH